MNQGKTGTTPGFESVTLAVSDVSFAVISGLTSGKGTVPQYKIVSTRRNRSSGGALCTSFRVIDVGVCVFFPFHPRHFLIDSRFVLFCIAFTAACMEHTESSVRAITGVAFGIVSLLTMWGVQVVFDFEGGRKEHCLEWLRGCFRGGARRSSSIV